MNERIGDGQIIRHHLKAWRKKKGMTLQQLADEIGGSKSHLSRVEKFLNIMTPAVALKAALALGIDTNTLWNVAPDSVPPEPDDEDVMLDIYRQLDPDQQKSVITMTRALIPTRNN